MKLRNKETGEIGYFCFANWNDPVLIIMDKDGVQLAKYTFLAELNEEWEDYYEEPKGSALDLMILTLINFIENEPDEDKVDLEDCKQMLEKLRAWKRLKDKGFRFDGWNVCDSGKGITIFANYPSGTKTYLDLLFGGEE